MAGSPAHGPPLLAEALGEIESAESLVTWGLDAWGCRRIVGLRELRVAALLFACSQQQEESSASRDWAGLLDFVYNEQHGLDGLSTRPASLLDLAVRLGHTDVARCLHQRGQRQKRTLGPYDFQQVPTESLATLPLRRSSRRYERFGEWRRNEEDGVWEQEHCLWHLRRWMHLETLAEPLCPWGHWTQGDWASDWNASIPCARTLVDAPATRAALALAAEGVPLDLEEGAAVRLLDAALLLGEPGAAAALADRCGSRRPVRFWPDDGVENESMCTHPMGLESVEGHLRAGHRDLQALGFADPADAAAEAVRAGSRGLAQALSGLFGQDEPPAPLQLNGFWLVQPHGAGTAVVKPAALDALEALGSPPPACRVQVLREESREEKSLLLFSCALGDERAARRLVRMGSTFTGFDAADKDLQRGSGLAPVPRRLEVVEGSLRQLFVAAAWRSCCTIAATKVCNLLGRPELLGQVVGFAMSWSDAEEGMRQEVQRLIGHDPLGDLAPRALWSRTMPSPATVATAMQAALLPPLGQLPSEQLSDAPGGRAPEPLSDHAAGSTLETHTEPRGSPVDGPSANDEAAESEQPSQAKQQIEPEAIQVEEADIQRAILLSEEEALDEPVYTGLYYALLRLNTHSREMVEALLASEALRPCREQVVAAGCELQPAWAGGALLFVPMTPELYVELGLELSAHHVFIQKDDVRHLQAALRTLPRRCRPQLHQDHRAKRYTGSAEDLLQKQAAGDGSTPSGVAPEEDEGRSADATAAAAADEAGASADELQEANPKAIFDMDLLREYGIVVQNTFLQLPAASASKRTTSAPAAVRGQDEDQPARGSGPHACNPRPGRQARPTEG